MIEIREHGTRAEDEQALIEALTRPGQASLVDALLALPDDEETARLAADGKLQAELARTMRSLLRRRPPKAA